jgi:hypothetical protein
MGKSIRWKKSENASIAEMSLSLLDRITMLAVLDVRTARKNVGEENADGLSNSQLTRYTF